MVDQKIERPILTGDDFHSTPCSHGNQKSPGWKPIVPSRMRVPPSRAGQWFAFVVCGMIDARVVIESYLYVANRSLPGSLWQARTRSVLMSSSMIGGIAATVAEPL